MVKKSVKPKSSLSPKKENTPPISGVCSIILDIFKAFFLVFLTLIGILIISSGVCLIVLTALS